MKKVFKDGMKENSNNHETTTCLGKILIIWQPYLEYILSSVVTLLLRKSIAFHYKKTLHSQKTLHYK